MSSPSDSIDNIPENDRTETADDEAGGTTDLNDVSEPEYRTMATDPTLRMESDTETTRPAAPIQQQPAATPEAVSDVAQPPRLGIRMRSVVMGFVLMVIAVLVLINQLTDASVDLGAVVLGVMICCGLLLVAGARRT
jgi:hypothetical protein